MIRETRHISRRLLWVFALSILLAWPMLFISAPLVYFDTFAYLGMGEQTIALAKTMLLPASGAGASGSAAAEPDVVRTIRAVSYAVYLFGLSKTVLGLALPVVVQTALTLSMLLPFVKDIKWYWQSYLTLSVLVFLSTLPWIASYAMPDILAAVVIVWSALLMRSIDTLDRVAVILFALIAAFAVSAHYGHIPLAILLTAAVALIRLIQKRITLRFLIVAPIPILAAMALNLTASAVALDQPSFAPKRLPILLARSLEDGPAAWYLRDHCANSEFTMCEVFGEDIPQNITEFLWNEGGIKSLSAETLDAIRAEEKNFLLAAFKAYPVAQLWSLTGNALRQIITVGTGELHPIERLSPTDGLLQTEQIGPQDGAIFDTFDWLTKVGTLMGFIMVLVLWKRGKLNTEERDLALLVIMGLIANAIIFGGLSAPVDRYQSRVAWLLPALWFIHAARTGPDR